MNTKLLYPKHQLQFKHSEVANFVALPAELFCVASEVLDNCYFHTKHQWCEDFINIGLYIFPVHFFVEYRV